MAVSYTHLIYIAVDREILRANPIEDVAYEKKEPLNLRHISRGAVSYTHLDVYKRQRIYSGS